MVNSEFYPDWEAVYRDNVDWVYRLMFAKVADRADAEDLTAEVFLAALGPLRVSASVGEVRGYLTATARTVLVRHWRATLGREITTITEGMDPPAVTAIDSPPESDGSAAVSDQAARVLAGLPEQYCQVLRLRFLEG